MSKKKEPNPIDIALAVIGIVCIMLKLGGVIDWSWWVVTLPFWIGIAVGLVFAGLTLVFGAVAAVVVFTIEWFQGRRRGK